MLCQVSSAFCPKCTQLLFLPIALKFLSPLHSPQHSRWSEFKHDHIDLQRQGPGHEPHLCTLDVAVVVYPCCIRLAFTDENVLLKYSHEIDELLSLTRYAVSVLPCEFVLVSVNSSSTAMAVRQT